jgi:outer membrane protein assembly factor BamB
MRFDCTLLVCCAVSLAAALLLSATSGFGAELHRTIVWSTQIANGTGSPVPYPSAEAADSIVVCSGSRVVRLDGQGRVMSTYDIGDWIGGAAACADIDGDGKVEIVACTVRGHVVAITGQGKAKWSYETRHSFGDFANVVLAQRAGGKGRDVLVNHRDGWLTCLDGKGQHRWSFRIAEPGHISSPAVADINRDGQPEYVSGIDAARVVALTNDGHLLWEFAAPEEFGREVAVIADADRNGVPEVYILKAGATSAVFCLDAPTGKLFWVTPIPSKCYCALTVTDINGDGYGEVLAGTKYNQVIAYSRSGEKLWQAQLGGTGIYASPTVGDVDGDGRLEIAVGARQADIKGNSFFVLDTLGNVLGAYPQGGEAGQPEVIADINGDGKLEVVSCSRDTVWAYQFGNPTKAGKVPWPCYRANAALTGSLLPLRAAKVAAPAHATGPKGSLLPKTFETVLGETKLRATWSVATPERGYVEVTLIEPNGKRTVQAFRTAQGKRSVELELPFTHGGRYAIEARLLDTAKQRVLVAERREVAFTPLATERKMVESVFTRERGAAAPPAPKAPQIAAELQRRRSDLYSALASLEGRVRDVREDEFPQAVLDAASQLRAQVAREKSFMRLAQKVAAASPEMLFVAWQDSDPWDNTDPRDELPAAAAPKAAFSAWTYGNQREDFCIDLVPLGPEPFEVRVEPADLVGPNEAKASWDRHLTLLQVVWMPTVLNPTPVPDMLPAMNAGRTVPLAPGGFAQVWLVVDTKDLAPGEWTLNLHLQSLTMAAAAVDMAVRLDVLPVALPYPYPWKMCNWSWPTSFPEPLRDKIIENLISHGSNVIYAPTPSQTCDEQGRLVGTVDWSALDSLVAKAKPGEPFLFFGSLPLSAPAGMTQDSPVWKQAYKRWMHEFVQHLASIGITYRDFAFYPVDEPGNSGHTGIEQLIAAAKILRAADPNAPIYADPAGGAYTTEWIKELDPWVDVWQPASGLSDRKDIYDIISTRNRRVWMYDAPGEVRMLPPLGFYRRQPWTALRNGARGSGFWVYYQDNMWAVGARNEPSYGTVMIDRTEVVDSRRWRAAHDGVQDVTAVLLLDDAIAEAEKAGVDPALPEKARAVRATALEEVNAGIDANLLPFDVLQRNRRAIADALVELRAAVAAKKR